MMQWLKALKIFYFKLKQWRNRVMTQEDKQLLFKDLCARLPYGIKVQYDSQTCKLVTTNDDYTVLLLGEDGYVPNIEDGLFLDIEKVKPYLRSMDDMTDDEKKEYFGRTLNIGIVKTSRVIIDWFLEHHFDFRNLIEKGLAIEITEENNPYK